MRITPDQLTKSLESQGIRPETLKARIKADMVWSNLVRGRYKESLQIGEKEVEEKAKEQGDEQQTEAEGFAYKMQPIVLIVPRGSAPEAMEVRKKEAEALRARIQSCTEANSFFKSMQNAAIRETVIKTSAISLFASRNPTARRSASTPPEVTKQGVEMVALCAGIRPRSIRRRRKKSGKRCMPKNTRRNRNRTCRKSAEPR